MFTVLLVLDFLYFILANIKTKKLWKFDKFDIIYNTSIVLLIISALREITWLMHLTKK